MILDPTLKLEMVLAGAVTANQPEVHVEYFDWNPNGERTKPAPFRTALNGVSDVTILAAPAVGYIREVTGVALYNKDTAAIVPTIKTDDGTTERIRHKCSSLASGRTLFYEKGVGWYLST